MKAPAHYKETTYGFEWGAVEVTRVFSDKGRVYLQLRTKRANFTVWVTRTGKMTLHTLGFVKTKKVGLPNKRKSK